MLRDIGRFCATGMLFLTIVLLIQAVRIVGWPPPSLSVLAVLLWGLAALAAWRL